jgi:hypothetical protein
MTMDVEPRRALEALDARLRTLLPEEYQDSYDDVQPVSMRSAGLKYSLDGRVAWNEMWQTFCDLAMAGGPPHKGTLLEPGRRTAIDAQPVRYTQVTDEIRRGIEMVTELPAEVSPLPGWVRVTCLNQTMAGWLHRAIVMENVAARREYNEIDLPAAPVFRIEKEVKNVITVIAKTCHYWMGHMPYAQQRAIGDLFRTLDQESPLVEPPLPADAVDGAGDRFAAAMADRIQHETGLPASPRRYAGWLGLECQGVRPAVWMMRALVATNVLSRREGTVLFVPVNPESDPSGDTVVRSVATIHQLEGARHIV